MQVKSEGDQALNTLNALDNLVAVLMRLEEWKPVCSRVCWRTSRAADAPLVSGVGARDGPREPHWRLPWSDAPHVLQWAPQGAAGDFGRSFLTWSRRAAAQVGQCAVRIGDGNTVVTAAMIVRSRRLLERPRCVI